MFDRFIFRTCSIGVKQETVIVNLLFNGGGVKKNLSGGFDFEWVPHMIKLR